MRKARTFQAQKTQSQILKAALSLFNQKNVSGVTTHDIAEKVGISPGNLYYHFKNKEEIVRALFWQMELFSGLEWKERGPWNPKEGMVDFMRFFFGELEQYRFFFREFTTLMRNDPVLVKLWHIRYEHLFQDMRETANLWVQGGILKPFKNISELDAFIENFWTLANFHGVHAESRKGITKQNSHNFLLHYLHPYHTLKGQRVIEMYFNS